MANQIKNIYNEFMKSKGWYDEIIIYQLKPILNDILKKDVSELLFIRNLANGNLVIQVNSSVWKYELIQRKNQIIDEINSKISEYKIYNIDFI